ncbi:hypothetical protein IWW54_006263, partial [Coemansia sp. RSA 2705]
PSHQPARHPGRQHIRHVTHQHARHQRAFRARARTLAHLVCSHAAVHARRSAPDRLSAVQAGAWRPGAVDRQPQRVPLVLLSARHTPDRLHAVPAGIAPPRGATAPRPAQNRPRHQQPRRLRQLRGLRARQLGPHLCARLQPLRVPPERRRVVLAGDSLQVCL